MCSRGIVCTDFVQTLPYQLRILIEFIECCLFQSEDLLSPITKELLESMRPDLMKTFKLSAKFWATLLKHDVLLDLEVESIKVSFIFSHIKFAQLWLKLGNSKVCYFISLLNWIYFDIK